MVVIRRLLLDVLKAHEPNVVEFARNIGMLGPDYRVSVNVNEIDDKTQTLEMEIESADIDYDAVLSAIEALGASVHSVDHVVVESTDRARAARTIDG